jgi:hypothetical protein
MFYDNVNNSCAGSSKSWYYGLQKLKFFHEILSVIICKFVCNSSSAETTETEFSFHVLELNKTPTQAVNTL